MEEKGDEKKGRKRKKEKVKPLLRLSKEKQLEARVSSRW